ncbi:TetR/AcrR family transcriptional regulator [Actinomadura sp. NAK00032]|uniref:TetR/AcrR family transcriptional regulator n=1 Tax=Actinomadura sp. NAK00032 TaxID=2742128 RepID=UPI0015920A52|nr:TetR/AcrR family transcriptional regulator [Actinomadura sp. NAK00032]QKW38073.1 TetR/AcrR family transcriptional regulator [Actinomadura sp. NAK00032]
MNEPVKGLRAARVAETERRILRAARALFVRDGYHATTLTAVADHAGVGHRTVYVRFGTKAALLRHAVDVAVAGDTADRAVAERNWYQSALTGPALADRIEALVDGTAGLMERAGDLFDVVLQAQATEPELAEAFRAGRADTRELLRRFVRSARADGLLTETPDPEWQEETVALAGQAETYLLLRRTTGWAPAQYRDWLHRTLVQVLTA